MQLKEALSADSSDMLVQRRALREPIQHQRRQWHSGKTHYAIVITAADANEVIAIDEG